MPITAHVVILGFAVFFYKQKNFSFSSSLLLSVSIITFITYVFGLIGKLDLAVWAVSILGLGLGIWNLKQTNNKILELWKNPVFIAFIIYPALYLYKFADAEYFFWDEFSFWGVYVREMLVSDTFWDATTSAGNSRYVPGTPIWHYLYSKVYGYSEGKTLYAQFILLLIPTLVLYERAKGIISIASILIIHLLAIANLGHGIVNLYVDHLLGVWVFGVLTFFLINFERERELYWIIFPLITLILIKDSGLFLSLGCWFSFFMATLLNEWNKKGELKLVIEYKKRFLIHCGIILLIMICVQISWEIRLNMIGMPAGQSITTVAPKILWKQDTSINKSETINRFFEILFLHQISKSEISYEYNEFNYNIKNKYEEKNRLSYIGYLLLFFTSLIFFYSIGNRLKNVLTFTYLGFFITSVGYLLIVLGVYLYQFQRSDLPSMIRYVNSVTLPMFLLTFILFFPVLEEFRKEIKKKKLETIIVIIVILSFLERPYIKPLHQKFPRVGLRILDERILKIKERINLKESTLIAHNIKDNGFTNTYLKYSFSPNKINITNLRKLRTENGLTELISNEYIFFLIQNQIDLGEKNALLGKKIEQNFFKLSKISESNYILTPVF